MAQNRVISLDTIRGFAVFLMIIYHFCFDLDYFGFITIDLFDDMFWKAFRTFIISSFLFSLGYSLILSNNILDIKKTAKKLLILLVLSSLVTIATYFIFPYSWIYFGILHFIIFGYFVALFFRAFSAITLLIIASILHTLYLFDYIGFTFLYEYLKPILTLPGRTEDLLRFFPWFSMVLIGMSFAKAKVLEKIIIQDIKPLSFLSHNALVIYIIHQPILFSLVYLFTFI